MHPLHSNTPLVISKPMSQRTGATVYVKMEALQPSGSFKLRGIGHVCQAYQQQGALALICASGGNAGLAVAYAGRQLGLAVTIIVPKTTSQKAMDAIVKEKANIYVYGKDYHEAHEYALSLSTPQQPYVHSYDNPLLWSGHASLIDELKATSIVPDLIVLSVGGGGLLCGVVEGLVRNGWSQTPILAVETKGAHALALSMQAQKIKALSQINSVATSLGARQIAQKAFEYSQQHPVISHVLSDQTAVASCLRFYDEQHLVVEPACGAALAAIYQPHPILSDKSNIVVIACGGVGTSLEQLQQWQTNLPQKYQNSVS